MRRVYLLRDAKSSWKDRSLADRDRPLAGRGRRAARAIADHLGAEGIRPELVLCSPARRGRETLERVRGALGDEVEVVFEEGLYGASGAGRGCWRAFARSPRRSARSWSSGTIRASSSSRWRWPPRGPSSRGCERSTRPPRSPRLSSRRTAGTGWGAATASWSPTCNHATWARASRSARRATWVRRLAPPRGTRAADRDRRGAVPGTRDRAGHHAIGPSLPRAELVRSNGAGKAASAKELLEIINDPLVTGSALWDHAGGEATCTASGQKR